MRPSLVRLLLFSLSILRIAPAMAQENGWTFHKAIGRVDLSSVKGQYDEAIITITYPDGRKKEVDKHLSFPLGDVLPFEASRLVVLPAYYGDHAAVLDIDSATVVDEFWVVNPLVSPSNRFIAFSPITPRWADASDVYFIYDVSLSPSQNRMPNGKNSSFDFDVGWAIYPNENSEGKTYARTLYADREDAKDQRPSDAVIAAMHHRASSLTWLSDTQVAFLDSAAGECKVVVADLAAGITKPAIKTRTLPSSLIPGRISAERITRVADQDGAMVLRLRLQPQPPTGVRWVDVYVR